MQCLLEGESFRETTRSFSLFFLSSDAVEPWRRTCCMSIASSMLQCRQPHAQPQHIYTQQRGRRRRTATISTSTNVIVGVASFFSLSLSFSFTLLTINAEKRKNEQEEERLFTTATRLALLCPSPLFVELLFLFFPHAGVSDICFSGTVLRTRLELIASLR